VAAPAEPSTPATSNDSATTTAAEPAAAPTSDGSAAAPAADKATVPAQRPAAAAPAEQAPPPRKPTSLANTVLPGEKPWTRGELNQIRRELESQVSELRGEISDAEQSWAALQRDSGEGAGDDQADAGTKTFEREHEMSLAANSRDLLSQVERALQRLDDKTYGSCESCGNPIGKARLQAFPRATLCVTCKQREERR
jgi:RNA polymerase-binding protein DksA